ncbi:hypothetical protein EJB05_37803, partial [Eragrostis curvula]
MQRALLPQRLPAYAAAWAPLHRQPTAGARTGGGLLGRLAARGLIRASEASVPSRPLPFLQRRDDDARPLLRPAAAVASGGEGIGRARGQRRRPRFLCLHGFRTSAEIMRTQVLGRWPADVTARLDLVFADAPFPAEGRSDVEGIFDPPYYEWFQFVGEDYLKCRNLDRCLSYVEELMAREGPFDGLMGFSQGAGLSAVLAGLQEQGLALTGVAKVRYVIAIAGPKLRSPAAASRAFDGKIKCPSLHFIGDNDFVKVHSEELVEAFADPLVIHHPCGHTVPRLDEKGLQVMLSYLDKIERDLSDHEYIDDPDIMNSEALHMHAS